MMNNFIDLNSVRAKKARLGKLIGPVNYRIITVLCLIFIAAGVVALFKHDNRLSCLLFGLSLLLFFIAIWYRQELSDLPISGESFNDRISGAILSQFKQNQPLTPRSIWHTMGENWQFAFFTNRFLLPPDLIEAELSENGTDLAKVWESADQLAIKTGSKMIEPGHLAASLLLNSSGVLAMLTRFKLSPADIDSGGQWLSRIVKMMASEKSYYGGIGRDWAYGFTPRLNQYGNNIGKSIENNGAHFGWLTSSPGVEAMKNSFDEGATALALVGDPGIGKTSHVYALGQILIEGTGGGGLEHKQLIQLDPSVILSNTNHQGDLEHIVRDLMDEAQSAGHIILFFDNAELFFKNGTGSFDATSILLPIIQAKSCQMIFAMTPADYQALKANQPEFSALLTPIILKEPDEHNVIQILEDTSINLEYQFKVHISYQAVKEAYRLSGRYDQEVAYPGKAINLLKQSLPYAEQKIVTEASVQHAVEQTRGVKVSTASPTEAGELLNLENEIHQRMVNQVRAVNVVAGALRRNRAGVANPNRPIGSFLFLGPTGVGKTELARSLAATYFHSESNMIRLDMSEYQQISDESRLLDDGRTESISLITAARQHPFSVLLLDEIEKAHPNILNLLLQLLDEGKLTDNSGHPASFKDCIIIATSNAGAQLIRQAMDEGKNLEQFEGAFVDQLIYSNQFKPEFINRFDEVVLFRPLNQDELAQVVKLMMKEVNQTLSTQKISVELTVEAVKAVVAKGYDARLGARPMRRTLQSAVEDNIANKILKNEIKPGDHVVMDVTDLSF
ncbi:MAG TPA: AAA family ATPase [Patescibacteria group bacterium]|jgi:ATP-dependent Clp protease ATP-binding subunit ClpC|nr:AAA family ATPase [Patescibacteria group bacterium]